MMTERVLDYDELELRIAPGGAEGSYRLLAIGPDGSRASRAFSLPFDERELDNFVLTVGQPRRGMWSSDSPKMQDARQEAKLFGSRLFEALVAGDVRDIYFAARRVAEQRERGLRLTLYLTDVPELMEVPWEFLWDRPTFLSQSIYTPLVRSLDLKAVGPPRKLTLPLRILGMVSSPAGVDKLDVDSERAKLEEALCGLKRDGIVDLRWLEHATLKSLEEAVRAAGDLHVLHYVGHGAYDRQTKSGILALETHQGAVHEATGEDLGSVLQNELSLRLVVLNACEGARGSHVDPFSGVAASLVEHRIPAVIGMQFEITDGAAIAFAGRFYSALAQGLPVDAALARSRVAIFAAGNSLEFGTPVLFLRADEARLFDPKPVKNGQADHQSYRGASDLTLSLDRSPADAKSGQPVRWTLEIQNTGPCELNDVTARNANGDDLAESVEIAPGRRHTIRWTEPFDPALRHLITVAAKGADGSSISEQIIPQPVIRALPVGDIIATTCACLLILSLALTWRTDLGLVGWNVLDLPGLLVAVALGVAALAALRGFHAGGHWRTGAGVGVVVCGMLAIEAFVLQDAGGNGAGRALALIGGAGVVLGGWLALSSEASQSRAWPSTGEIIAGLGAVAVIASLWLAWEESGENAWKYGFSDVVAAVLSGSVAIMVCVRGALRMNISSAATLAVILIGSVLVHRIGWFSNIVTSGGGQFTWEMGRIVGLIGAVAILAGGFTALIPQRSRP
jgi:hypothetical protein